MNPQTFIFVGRSGCGKGTQAKMIIAKLKEMDPLRDVCYVETGQAFRNFLKSGSYSASLSQKVNDAGGLQPEFLAVWAWANSLLDNLKENEHLVLDGSPRKLHEAEVLDSALKFYGRSKPFLIYMNVSREWSKERLMARGRGDDVMAMIENRLEWFDREVLPAVEYFRNNPNFNFADINGEQTIEEVHGEIISKTLGKM